MKILNSKDKNINHIIEFVKKSIKDSCSHFVFEEVCAKNVPELKDLIDYCFVFEEVCAKNVPELKDLIDYCNEIIVNIEREE